MKQAWAARVGHLFEGCPSIVSKGILGDLDHFFGSCYAGGGRIFVARKSCVIEYPSCHFLRQPTTS